MPRVLVLDPDEDFRESVRLVLERARIEAVAAGDAAEALPLADAGLRVLVDAELRALARPLAARGARVIPLDKPVPPARLLAAVARR